MCTSYVYNNNKQWVYWCNQTYLFLIVNGIGVYMVKVHNYKLFQSLKILKKWTLSLFY